MPDVRPEHLSSASSDIRSAFGIALSKILLIDDNAMQLHIRESILREAGLDVDTADTAAVAMEMLCASTHSGDIGAVVTDHIMPGKNGAEFVRELRKVNPNVPVIALSGMAEAEEEYAGLDVVFRQKPCPPRELIELVQKAIGR